ncbi:hypothetical protein SNE40_020327 [Patella caerulea]|uniref:RING-type domain-containing protein n=1 Tax=Patella caerulea TaxID=87958 RepID=A0AAN8G2L7_PATCE
MGDTTNLLSQYFVRLASFDGLINRTEYDSDCQYRGRLETVSVSHKTSVIKLARAGFYYAGPVEGIQCFICKSKARYSSWNNESPVGVHRILNPYCPFLQSYNFDNNNNNHNDLSSSTSSTQTVASYHVGTFSQHPNNSASQPQGTLNREELSDNYHETAPRNGTLEISSQSQHSRNNNQRNISLNIGRTCNQLNENILTVPNSWNQTTTNMSNTSRPTLNTGNNNIGSRSSYTDHVEEYTGKIVHPKIGHKIFGVYESFRVLTFPNPQNEKAEEWAEDGFIYVDNDLVQCVYCVGCASFQEINVRDTHERLFPESRHLCPMVSKIDIGNVSRKLEVLVRSKLLNKSNQPSVSCVTTYPALHPQFMSEEERISSFKYWPKQYKPTKCQLAEAGFFHTGVGTKVVCFCCGVAVIDWEPIADPWQQHSLISPRCGFIKYTKRPEFIQEMAGSIENLVKVDPEVTESVSSVGDFVIPDPFPPTLNTTLLAAYSSCGFTPSQLDLFLQQFFSKTCGRYPSVDMLKAVVLADGELNKHVDIIGLQDDVERDQHFKATVASLNQECDLLMAGKDQELRKALEEQRQHYDHYIQQLNQNDQLLQLHYYQQMREKDDLSHQLQTAIERHASREDNLQQQLQTADANLQQIQQQLQTAGDRQLNLQEQLQIQQIEHKELETQRAQLEAKLQRYKIELSTLATELSRLNSIVREINNQPNPGQENVTCFFCLSNERNVLLRPCKHVCCCVACTPHFINSTCPICRTPVQDWELIFLP